MTSAVGIPLVLTDFTATHRFISYRQRRRLKSSVAFAIEWTVYHSGCHNVSFARFWHGRVQLPVYTACKDKGHEELRVDKNFTYPALFLAVPVHPYEFRSFGGLDSFEFFDRLTVAWG